VCLQPPVQDSNLKKEISAATGYVDGLYTIPGLTPEDAQFVEREFMKLVDDWAAKAVHVLLQRDPKTRDLTTREQVGWARFIFSLMLRTPEQIDRLKTEAVEREYEGPVEQLLPDFINSTRVISFMVKQMTFHTLELPGTKHKLLTSDRPIMMTNGIFQPDGELVIPISPTRLFIAVRERRTVEEIAKIDPNTLIATANDRVAAQARRFVYGVDDSQLRFVANRFGRMSPSTPFESS
jgi:hypothetical protein